MQRDYDYASAIHFADLRSAETVGREAGERAVKAGRSAQGEVPGRAGDL